jgi:nucleoside-diphosphate-sugar epimerase
MAYKRYDLKKILITGASGIVGNNICTALIKEKIKFKKLSSFSKNKKFRLEKIDSVLKLSKKVNPTLIIHCAIDDKLNPNLKKNIKMIENLSKFFDSPIIYISSVSVYENTKKLYLNENMKLTKFNSKYAKVKKICEDKILSRNNNEDLCLRIPGIFSKERKSGIIFNLKKKVFDINYNFKIFDLKKQWQCINNEHFQYCIIKILKSKIYYPKIMNLGYDEKISLTKAILLFNKKLPKTKKIVVKKKTVTTKLNVKNLKKILKKKNFTLEQGINLLFK